MHNSGFLVHLENDCIPFPQNELVIFAIRDIIPLLTVLTVQALLTLLTLLTVQALQALLTLQGC